MPPFFCEGALWAAVLVFCPVFLWAAWAVGAALNRHRAMQAHSSAVGSVWRVRCAVDDGAAVLWCMVYWVLVWLDGLAERLLHPAMRAAICACAQTLVKNGPSYNWRVLHGARRTPVALPASGASKTSARCAAQSASGGWPYQEKTK